MGGFTSSAKKKEKKDIVKVKLSVEQKRCIVSMFNVVPGRELEITCSMLRKIWRFVFSDKNFKPIAKHLFKQEEYIKLEDLELFYYMMVEGTTKDRAKALIDVFGTEDHIPVGCLKTILLDLIEDYIGLIRRMTPNLLSSWIIDDTKLKCDLDIVIEFILNDLSCTNEKVGVNEVEIWLDKSVFLTDVLDSLMKFAFSMDMDELRPILPSANMQSSILSVPLALVLAHVIDAHMKKGWRLLYSPKVNAQSWSMFCRSLLKQGPSVVLIEHPDGQLFGGYASQSWKLWPTFYGDHRSFLFQLRPKVLVFPPTGFNNNFQYLNSAAVTLPNGLGMGGNTNYFTFFLRSDLGPVCVSKSSTTFRDYVPFSTPNYDFNFTMLEIWATDDPDKEETDGREGSIRDRDPSIAAVLELAGKNVYSRHIKNGEEW